jgi:hypothetical protein
MTFSATCEELKTYTIKRGDPDFLIQGKFTISPRASIQVSNKCPREYAMIIQTCLERGWVQPIATITERERMFMGLTNGQRL